MRSFRNGFTGRWAVVAAAALFWGMVFEAQTRADVENWNDANIKWMSYDEGLAAAKKDHKPICLIFFTTWCPHCKNYSTVFSDPQVVKKAQAFVMIRLDKDKNAEISKKYAPDGEYIPRTYFLSSDGALDPALSETRDQFKYFYNEKDPASLLAGMDRALKKLQ
ncbi:MAG TPA: thioredoxin family protein [Candidatus Margulisiibacteriota bacterium]|nr:thioredoxin family protein [Candidatus Margulisiibacteriota bacterium]